MSVVTNLLTQVANLAGTATDSNAVETWLLDGARKISKYGKLSDKLGEFAKTSAEFLNGSTPSASVDDLGEIIEVTRGGGSQAIKVCRYVGHNEWQKASDTTSLFYENSADNPIYSILPSATHSTLYVSPTPVATTGLVNVKYIPEYALDGTDNIDYFPRKYYHLCIYYAAIKELGRKLKDATIAIPSLPVSPASPSFTYTDASVIDIVYPIISTSLLADMPSALTVSLSPPVPPVLDDTTINTSGLTNPTFVAPVMSNLDFSDTNNWISEEEDPEMLTARINEIQAKIGDYNARMGEAQSQFNKENAILNKDLQIAIENARMSNSADAEKLQKYSQELQSYSANVNTEIQEYSQNFARWQADAANDLQIAIQNMQSELTVKQANMSKDAQINLQNAINSFQEEVQEYQSDLAKYQADLGKYQAELGANAQTYQAEVAGLQLKLQQCQAMYQEAVQLEFQISVQADVLDKQGA
jgi:hypothetical protein